MSNNDQQKSVVTMTEPERLKEAQRIVGARRKKLRRNECDFSKHAGWLPFVTDPEGALTQLDVGILAGMHEPNLYGRWERGERKLHLSSDYLVGVLTAVRLPTPQLDYVLTLLGMQPPTVKDITDAADTTLLQRLVDGWSPRPAYVHDSHIDILVSNVAARAVFVDHLACPNEQQNIVWQMFNAPFARETIEEWDAHARALVSLLHMNWLRFKHDGDERFGWLLDKLLQDEKFNEWWHHAEMSPEYLRRKVLKRPEGTLRLDQVLFTVNDAPECTLVLYSPVGDDDLALVTTIERKFGGTDAVGQAAQLLKQTNE